jgi:hypothetical protein
VVGEGRAGLFFRPMPSHTSASSQVHDESQERQSVEDDIRWAKMAQIAVFTHLHIQPCVSPSPSPPVSFSSRTPKLEAAAPTKRKARETEAGRLGAIAVSASVSEAFDRTVGGQFLPEREEKKTGRKGCSFWTLILSVMWEARPACVLLVVGSLFSSLKSALATLSLLLALSLTSNFLITCIFCGLSFELLILVLPKDFSVLMKQPPIM